MTKALEIAKYIISECFKMNSPVTNLRLQKNLYFVQLESYRRCGCEAFEDEIEAWQFGPVVPLVYYEYCNYAGMPILEKYDTFKKIDEELKDIIDDVINKYSEYPVWDLVNITHKEGSPWSQTYVEYEKKVISKELIKKEAIKQ